MLKWQDIKKDTKRNEIFGIIVTFLLFLIGTGAEILVNEGRVLIILGDISTFSMTLLQILASISTLVIAIIALLAGNVNDTYLGVAISDYYFNIKPYFFTQKRIIKLSIIYVLLSIVLHILGFYNLVFVTFCSNLILIYISTMAIYKVFFGRYVQSEEINAYIKHVINEKGKLAKVLLTNYINDWKKEVNYQNPNEYKEMSSFVQECLLSFLVDDENDLKYFEDTCYSILSYMLSSDKTSVKCFGIEFIYDIYMKIYVHVLDNDVKLSHLNIFLNVEEEFIHAMYDIKYDKFNRILDVTYFVEIIISIQLIISKNIDSKNALTRVSDIICATTLPNYYVHNMNLQGINQNDISNYRIKKLLNYSLIYKAFHISEDLKSTYELLINKSLINLYVTLFRGGYVDLLIESLYLNGIYSKTEVTYKAEASLILSMHCYLYYCAYRETDDCISKELRCRAYNILNDENVKKSYFRFISLLSNEESWIDNEFQESMHDLLYSHEMFPKYDNSKTMLIPSVVNEFYFFTVAYISHKYLNKKDIYKNIDDLSLMFYVIADRLNKTKDDFKTMYLLIEDSEDNVDENVDLMVKELLEFTKINQKNRIIEEARMISNEKILDVNIIESLKKMVEKRILIGYGSMMEFEKKYDTPIHISVINTYLPKDFLDEAIKRSSLINNINSTIYFKLIKYIQDANLFEINLINSINYQDYLKILENQKIDFLGGAYNIYKAVGYEKKVELDHYYNRIENKLNIYSSKEILIVCNNALRINLHDIVVNIRPSLITDINKFYKNPLKMYKHSVINGIELEFDETEFKEFVRNYYCTITVDIDLSVSIEDKLKESVILIKEIVND